MFFVKFILPFCDFLEKILAKLIMHMKAMFPELEIYDIMKPYLVIPNAKARHKNIVP